MNVLMFGWEFAPMFSGGLGVVCKSLTNELLRQNVGVTFVIPKKLTDLKSNARILSAEEIVGKLKKIEINSILSPYISEHGYSEEYETIRDKLSRSLYGEDLYQEVSRYTLAAQKIAKKEQFDLIHAHDWMTFQAGIAAKKISKKPLIVHIHNTVFDRGGNNPNHHEYLIEKRGFTEADKIIAVSNYTKNIVETKYGINPNKIEVVHNAVEMDEEIPIENKIFPKQKMVLFLGRVTMQKGPDYFAKAAKKVLEVYPNVKFIVAGSGDMQGKMIQYTAEEGISEHVLFTGALNRKDAHRAFKMADLYVMPSISEPFGVTPLEAAIHGTPSIISKNAGVKEVLPSALQTDFWDVTEMANKIIGALKYPALYETMQENMHTDLAKISWEKSANECQMIYKNVLGEL